MSKRAALVRIIEKSIKAIQKWFETCFFKSNSLPISPFNVPVCPEGLHTRLSICPFFQVSRAACSSLHNASQRQEDFVQRLYGIVSPCPLSPPWKSVTQKPEVSLVAPSLLPPPSSSVSRPPSLSVSQSSCSGRGWATAASNPTAAISGTSKKRSEHGGMAKGKRVFVCERMFCQREGHLCWSHLLIHPETRRTFTVQHSLWRVSFCREGATENGYLHKQKPR